MKGTKVDLFSSMTKKLSFAFEIHKQAICDPSDKSSTHANPPSPRGQYARRPISFSRLVLRHPPVAADLRFTKQINNFRYNPLAVQAGWERVQMQGTAEGAIPEIAQAHEPTGTGKSGERC